MKKYIKLVILLTAIFAINIVTTKTLATSDLTLSRIYVEPGTLEPEFSETREYYTLLLEPNVTNLVIQATPTNENLHYEIKGNENLKEGENIITITVFSNDKLKNKVYTINALKTSEPDKYNALLNTLIIDNYPFFEDFSPETFNYTVTNNEIDVNTLEVFAYPQNPNAKVEIIRNNTVTSENGNNNITITVTSENGLTTRKYTINPNIVSFFSGNNLNIYTEEINTTTNLNFKTFLILSLIIIIILIYFYKYVKNKM